MYDFVFFVCLFFFLKRRSPRPIICNHCPANISDCPWNDFRLNSEWVRRTFRAVGPPLLCGLGKIEGVSRKSVYSDWMHDKPLGSDKVDMGFAPSRVLEVASKCAWATLYHIFRERDCTLVLFGSTEHLLVHYVMPSESAEVNAKDLWREAKEIYGELGIDRTLRFTNMHLSMFKVIGWVLQLPSKKLLTVFLIFYSFCFTVGPGCLKPGDPPTPL